MSSTLKDLPCFNGTNYKCWAMNMESYLWSQGLWTILHRNQPNHVIDANGNITTDQTTEIHAWEDNNNKALGAIHLKMEPHIATKFISQHYTGLLWNEIETAYSKPMITNAFQEFKTMMDTIILDNNHPAPSFAKLNVQFARLGDLEYSILSKVQSMIALSKMLKYCMLMSYLRC